MDDYTVYKKVPFEGEIELVERDIISMSIDFHKTIAKSFDAWVMGLIERYGYSHDEVLQLISDKRLIGYIGHVDFYNLVCMVKLDGNALFTAKTISEFDWNEGRADVRVVHEYIITPEDLVRGEHE